MPDSIKEVEELMLDEGLTDDVLISLYKLKALELAMLKVTSCAEAQRLLDSPELQPFWVNKFNRLRIDKNSTFQFRNPEPQSRADFYCGYVLYLAALKEKQKGSGDKYNEYLMLSLKKFDSFYAAQEIVTRLIADCKDMENLENLQNLYIYITKQDSQIEQFKTPGCLLFANAYFYLAGFYQKLNLKTESIECYKACWEQLHLAQLLEKDSEREIHNAYFAQGIAASNVFGLNSIADIKNRCFELAAAALPYPVRNAIEKKAEITFKLKFNTCTESTDDYDTSVSEYDSSGSVLSA